jgi:hypothetical protein
MVRRRDRPTAAEAGAEVTASRAKEAHSAAAIAIQADPADGAFAWLLT